MQGQRDAGDAGPPSGVEPCGKSHSMQSRVARGGRRRAQGAPARLSEATLRDGGRMNGACWVAWGTETLEEGHTSSPGPVKIL